MAESSPNWVRLVIILVTVGVMHESELDPVTAPTENNKKVFSTSFIWGQSGVAVTRSHGNDQDVGSNPATDRNGKTHNGQTPAQKVPQ